MTPLHLSPSKCEVQRSRELDRHSCCCQYGGFKTSRLRELQNFVFIPNILFSAGRNKKVCWHADQPLTHGNVSCFCRFRQVWAGTYCSRSPVWGRRYLRVMSKQSDEALSPYVHIFTWTMNAEKVDETRSIESAVKYFPY